MTAPSLSRRACLQWLGHAAALGVGGMAHAAPLFDAQAVGQLAPWPAAQPTPSLHGQDLAGSARSLRDYLGQPLIVNFWATYCAPCRLEMPLFNALLQQYRAQGLRVLGVNHGEMPARVAQFLHSVPFAGDVLLDRSQTQLPQWGGIALPSSFVLDAQGRIHWWHVGEIDWTSAQVQAALRTAWKL